MGERISVRRVRELAEKKGIKSALALARASGINHNTARRWWLDDSLLTRFDESIIVALCETLEVEPGQLFELVAPD
jgi:DNA-binding Xre family transcriptional regulator